MNRRDVNNAIVGMAGVLAQTNQDADAEVSALQLEVQQLRIALEQHRGVVQVARESFGMGAIPGAVDTEMGQIFRVPADAVKRLREALKSCP